MGINELSELYTIGNGTYIFAAYQIAMFLLSALVAQYADNFHIYI